MITPNRVLLALVGVVAAVTVAAAVVAVNREPLALDRQTPEGVVQAYLQNLLDGDYEAAAGYLVSGCDADDLAQSWVPQQVRVTIRDVQITGRSAVVEVEITEISGRDFISDYEYRHDEEFGLRLEGNRWRVIGAAWPVYFCEGSE